MTLDTMILDTMNYLQALNASITGIVSAPTVDQYPTSLDTMNLPVVLSWPAEGEYDIKGGAAGEAHRTYRIMVYVAPVGVNDIPSNAVLGATLLQRFNAAYVNPNNIALANPPPYQLTIQSGPGDALTDTGLDSMPTYSGKNYFGFQLSVRVRAWWTS